MTTLKHIELTCPICHHCFDSQAVLSTNSFGGKRTDFHERAAGAQPLPYLIHLCSRSGYAGSERDFGEDADVSPMLKEHVWDELAPWQGAEPRRVADLLLRAAWCCGDEGDGEAERYFRRQSAWMFERALEAYDGVERDERAVLTYLVGESMSSTSSATWSNHSAAMV